MARLAAEGGDVKAMARLGRCLRRSDPREACLWLERAAAEGNVSAMGNLGSVFYDQGDVNSARRWWERAGALGSGTAMRNLGVLLAPDAPGEARGWLERAAEAGNVDGMGRLGQLLAESDPLGARRWLERAAGAGNSIAMASLGRLFCDQGDVVSARLWWERAAEAGSGAAMVNLGALVAPDAPGEARRWYERAAAAGSTAGMALLGVLLSDDDPLAAREWTGRAAAAGDVRAMLRLGLADRRSDPEQSRRWLERAAHGGSTRAMNVLGTTSFQASRSRVFGWSELGVGSGRSSMAGLGWVGEDTARADAERWFRRASELGDVDGTRMLAQLVRFRRPRESARLFAQAAAAGDPKAMAVVGSRIARRGRVWFRPVPAVRQEAIGLLRPAAEAGNVRAMTELGVLKIFGDDQDSGERWLARAAADGNRTARFVLGIHQLSDPGRAVRLLDATRRRRPWPAILRVAAYLQRRLGPIGRSGS